MALEIVSVHIPKTGGTSLTETFNQVYQGKVIRLGRKDVKIRNGKLISFLKKDTKVLHGHFYFDEVDKKLVENREIKFITFLRHPIERLISNHSHFLKTCREKKPWHIDYWRKNESLLKYASRTGTQNMMSRYLPKESIERFDFIGSLENFSEDMQKLGVLLNWPETPEFRENVAQSKNQISAQVLEQLIDWNQKDISLYEELTSRKISF